MGEAVNSSEIWSPTRGQCFIPNSNITRLFHTLDGIIACGGYELVNGSAVYDRALSTCETFIDGKWMLTHTLLSPRFGHNSWNTDDGIYLIGGLTTNQPDSRQNQISSNSTEKIISESSESMMGFELKYNLLGISCLINLGDTMILTNGYSLTEQKTKISRYNKTGWMEDLPDIGESEEISIWAGCSCYTNSDSKKVHIHC